MKIIKTKCGIEKYEYLKTKRGIFGKVRLIIFLIAAFFIDFQKVNK
tara:strand:+ start:167 stop:304 length:138 start_codon:yes stop_codon:yes gene_type:complete